jgi:hypothetical protein
VSEEAKDEVNEEMPAKALSNIYALKYPIDWPTGKIETIELKPNGKAMQGFSLATTGDGGVVLDHYKQAELGLRLGGLPRAVVDQMHPADITGLGGLALLFINGGLRTGKPPSP